MATVTSTQSASSSSANSSSSDPGTAAFAAAMLKAQQDDKSKANGNGTSVNGNTWGNLSQYFGTEQNPADGTAVQMAQQLSDNWDTWGLHQGVDFANPPASLPQQAKDVLTYFAKNPTLFNSIVQDNGGKAGDPITKAAVDNFINNANQDASTADQALNPQGFITSPGVETENTLNPAMGYGAELIANWHAWGLHDGIDFSHPPADLPQAAKDAMAYFANNPALFDSITSAGGGNPGDKITESALSAFVSQSMKDTQTAINDAGTGTPTTSMAAMEALDANWHTWGLNKGVSFDNPPAGLPQQAKDTLQYFAQNQTLWNAIVENNGGQAGGILTQAALESFLQKAASQTSDVTSLGQSAWDALAKGGEPLAADELNNPLRETEDIAQNWDAWGLHQGIDFSNPPSDLPMQAQFDLKAVAQNPALLNALKAGGNVITRDNVQNFINNANGDLQQANKDYSDWQSKNPNATATATEVARQAAILRANQTLITAADPNAKAGNITAAGLNAIADKPSIYGNELSQAAGLFGTPGMFLQLDTAGDNSSTSTPDGIASSANLDSFVTSAPSTDVAVDGMLTQAANYNGVADVDTSKLGADVFNNPQNYTGKQKAAVMMQLEQTYQKLLAGGAAGLWPDAGTSAHPNVNPSIAKVEADMLSHINQLSQDTDVQNFMQVVGTNSIQLMMKNDSGLKNTIQNEYKDFQSGKTLTDDLAQKDSNGKTVSMETGLAAFVQQGNFFSQALGTNDTPLDVNMPGIVKNSSQYAAIKAEYVNNVVSGNELKNAVANGTDPTQALQQFAGDVANFAAVLPPDDIKQYSGQLQQNYADIASDTVFGMGSFDDLKQVFGQSGDNTTLDEGKLTTVIQQLEAQNPNAFVDDKGNPIPPDKAVAAFRQVWDTLRGGAKVSDGLDKLKISNLGNKTIQDAYGKGYLHMISAVFAGGILIAKGATFKNSPTADASIIAAGATVMGSTMEAGSKYASKAPGGNPLNLSSNTLKEIENSGKMIGGLASVVGGVLGIVSGTGYLANGDKTNGGFALAGGIAGILAGSASTIEGGLGVATALGATGLESITAGIGVLAGSLGVATAVIGFLGTMIYGFIELGKEVQNSDQFQNEVMPVLDQYGITGGPVEPGDVAPNPGIGGN
jgi:trimeric autotransporter adhesin